MNLTTENANGVAIVRIGESRLMYPLLSEFSNAVTQLIAAGERKVVDRRVRTVRPVVADEDSHGGVVLSSICVARRRAR